MESSPIWIIDHKATLSDFSPMNLDGSSWILGVCVLLAKNKENALEQLHKFLKSEEMELIEVYELQEYSTGNFKDDSRRSSQINNAVRMVCNDGKTCYVYARTSEAMTEGGDANE